jgi:DNA-binding MarR family transcriptional regulator
MDATDLDLPTLASLTGPAVERLLLRRIADAGHAGVKPSHGYVIQRLIDSEPTIGELAASLAMTQQGASKQVADLEQLGYAERVTDGADQRIRRVRLTEAGRAMLASGRQARANLQAEVTRTVGAAEVEAAKRVLAAMLRLTGLDQQIATRSVPLPG